MASVSLLLSLLHWLFEMTDAFAERLAEHAPEVVDVYGTLADWKSGRYTLVYLTVPEPLFPNFHDCGDDLMQRRKHYFVSMFIQVGLLCLLLGVMLICARNKVRKHLDDKRSYRALANSESTEERRSINLVEFLINHPSILISIIYAHMAVQASVVYYCVVRNTMSDKMGVGYEFWFLFFGMHVSGCFTEVMLSILRPGHLDLKTFLQKFIITALPFISEKVDTAKDIVLAAVAYSHGQAVCAALYLLVLVGSQTYFAFSKTVKAELVETYLPILTSPVVHEKQQTQNVQGGEGDGKKEENEKSWWQKLYTFVRNELEAILLKQTTPARRIISIAEDLPQASLSIFLAFVSHASWFCLVAVAMSVVRLVLASQLVARPIRKCCVQSVHRRRVVSVRSLNKDLAVELTQQLWEVGAEDLEQASHPEDPLVLQMLASMIDESLSNADEKSLDMASMTSPDSPDCGVLLVLAALGAQRDNYIGRVKEFRELIAGGATPLHVAAQIGDTSCLAKLQMFGFDYVDAKDESGFTPICFAAIWGHTSSVSTLKGLGSRGNVENIVGQTRMHRAACCGCTSAIVILKKLGASLNEADDNDYTPMQVAAMAGFPACIATLKDFGVDLHQEDASGRNLIHIAAVHGKAECIAKLKEELLIDIHKTDRCGKTAMHHAASGGQASCIQALQKLGGIIDMHDKSGRSPILDAAAAGHNECVQALMGLGANVNFQDEHGRSSMYYAVVSSEKDLIKHLQNLGADATQTDTDGRTLLHVAAQNGLEVSIMALEEAGADVDAQDVEGLAPIHLAAAFAHPNAINALKSVGADMTAKDKSGSTPMHFGVIWGHEITVDTLKEFGIAVEKIAGETPMHRASCCGCTSAIGLLKTLGANMRASDTSGFTPMDFAVIWGHASMVDTLEKLGIYAVRIEGGTPLHRAARIGCTSAISHLKETGADAAARDNVGRSEVHVAADFGHAGSIAKLKEFGADMDAKTLAGFTAMHYAARRGHTDCVLKLKDMGADVDATTSSGRAAIHYAAEGGHVDCIVELKQLGADIEAKTTTGRTAMHVAASLGQPKSIEKLASLGAGIDTQSDDGDTPLHFAVKQHEQGAIDALKKLGANLDIQNKKGQKPLDAKW
eukprot:TRINITY_DN6100_c0_g1_i2.p1 TRINITY_DN6100_c0_g1~~TRINITY_DN6100_c0_g1_i2.p1  ORF type:complete len:1148 (-),score=195.91 TRINITY_DN6100_c0_g1_i2:258-3632(-)